jgi:hypothetical protein
MQAYDAPAAFTPARRRSLAQPGPSFGPLIAELTKAVDSLAAEEGELDFDKLIGADLQPGILKVAEQEMRACGAVMPDEIRACLAPHVSAMTRRDLSLLRTGVERAIDQCDEANEAHKSSLVLLHALRDCVADHHPKLSAIGPLIKTLTIIGGEQADPARLIGTEALPGIVMIAEQEMRYRGAVSPLEYRERLEPHLREMARADWMMLRENVDRLIQQCDRNNADHTRSLSLLLELRHCVDERVVAIADELLDAIVQLGKGDASRLARQGDIVRKLKEAGLLIEVTGVFDRRMRLLNESRLDEIREGLDIAQETPDFDMPAFDVIRAAVEVVGLDLKLARDLVRWKALPAPQYRRRAADTAKVHTGEPPDASHPQSVQPARAPDGLQPVRIQPGAKRRSEVQRPGD